ARLKLLNALAEMTINAKNLQRASITLRETVQWFSHWDRKLDKDKTLMKEKGQTFALFAKVLSLAGYISAEAAQKVATTIQAAPASYNSIEQFFALLDQPESTKSPSAIFYFLTGSKKWGLWGVLLVEGPANVTL